jgi:two-component system chemotaxis sensor kinase CheA
MKENIFQKFRDKFFEEANTLLDRFETDILELEKNPGDKELGESVFRAMHTIKGISAMYGFTFISEYTHFLENIFQNIRDGKLNFSREISELSLLSIDHIHKLLNDEKLENKELRSRHEELLGQVNKLSQSGLVFNQDVAVKMEDETGKLQTWCILISTSPKMEFRRINIHGICRDLSALGKFRLFRIPSSGEEGTDTWCICLVSKSSVAEISDVLMFIEDECTVFKISDNDLIFGSDAVENLSRNLFNEPSLAELIELENIPGKAEKAASDDPDLQSAVKQKSKRLSVETGKLDTLMYLVSQLITLNSRMKVAMSDKNFSALSEQIEVLDSLSKNFRDNAFEIRLVPFRDITLRFQRLIRDLSRSMGKKIELVTEGLDTELDKNILDSIVEPLIHIIRNCADHGIEDPLKRKERGKPETGIIKISASYSGNHILIKVEDDGNGIDLEKVRAKAVEKGILAGTDKPTEQDLYNIIFISGFTTASGLSEVSGRGVGMDIVKKHISDLRGTITVESKKGEGTTFLIRLNQSMTITDTLLFKVQETYFILPVSEIMACENADMAEIKQRKHTSLIEYNGELIPFIDMREYLNLSGEYRQVSKSIIVRSNDQLLAILADSIIGEHQAVLKPLIKTFEKETILSSVSQLGDGKLAFFINTVILSRHIVFQ